jgi:tight adherence protein B
MRRRFLTGLAALALVALAASSAFAQSAPLEVRTREVTFDSNGNTHITVTVTGSTLGNATLNASNFSVTEQGKPVTNLSVQPLFQNQQTAVSVVLIFDVSGSTLGAAHAAAQAAAKQFVNSLPAHVQIELIAFSDTARVAQGFTTNRAAVNSAIDQLTAAGSTALYDAVVLGANELKRQLSGQHNIVLFTDGDDTVSKATLASAENAVRAANSPVVGVLLKTATVNGTALQAITNTLKGGKYLQVTDQAQLASGFQAASQSIASQYVLSYPSNATTPNQLTLVVSATFSGANATDTSTVLNGRTLPNVAGPSAPPTVAPHTPIVGAFGGKTGLYLGAIAAFLGVLLFIAMLLYRPAGEEAERMLQRRLRLYTRGRDRKKQKQEAEGLLGGTAIGRKAVELAERVPRSKQFDEKLQKELDQAGWLLRSTEFILLQVGGAIVGLVIGWGLLNRLWLGVVFFVLGAMVPRVLLSQRMQKRTGAFLSQLPDTLQLLAGSLQAGYGFMQALDTVAKEATDPTSTEFARVLSEARLGMPVEDALDSMADRVGGEDFRWVVLAINIQRQVGGNLAALLSTVSNTLREREQVRRQIKVLSAEGRLSAIILVILPFALVGYLSIVNPSYLHQLTSATVGKIAIMIALALIGLGTIWMRKIIKIDV